MTFSVEAQRAKGNYNFLDFQQKPYYFGITLAYNSSNFKVLRSKDFIMSDSINTVESVTGPGFNLGIVTNLKIGDYFACKNRILVTNMHHPDMEYQTVSWILNS